MTPNHYMKKWVEITKHPFQMGSLEFQVSDISFSNAKETNQPAHQPTALLNKAGSQT